MKDIYNVWNGEKLVFTLNKISKIAGIEIPLHFEKIADEPIRDMTQYLFKRDEEDEGIRVLFITEYSKARIDDYLKHIKDGVVVISGFILRDDNGKVLETILLNSTRAVLEAWCKIGAYIKNIWEIPTIAITGLVGKTTTTSFMKNIFSQENKVFTSGGNLNTPNTFVRKLFLHYNSEFDIHIQETGGGRSHLVESAAEILNVDAFCISNILPHHLSKYKNIEGVLYDKTSLDRIAKKSAFGVINIDDDLLRKHKFSHRIVTCGILNKEADYVANNIRQDGMHLKMDILYRNEKTHISVNIPGKHNAYNVLLAFAMAKEFGISEEKIKLGFLDYKNEYPIRQNIKDISGRTCYIDCFNICAESIKSSLETMEELQIPAGCRKIAILGGKKQSWGTAVCR